MVFGAGAGGEDGGGVAVVDEHGVEEEAGGATGAAFEGEGLHELVVDVGGGAKGVHIWEIVINKISKFSHSIADGAGRRDFVVVGGLGGVRFSVAACVGVIGGGAEGVEVADEVEVEGEGSGSDFLRSRHSLIKS